MRAVSSIRPSSAGVVSERELLQALPAARAESEVSVMLQHTVRLLEGVLMMCV